MRKFLLFLLPVLLAIIVFAIFSIFFLKQNNGKGALQVTSLPASTVFLNGNPLGKTPLCKCDTSDMLPIGDYTIKLVPLDSSLASYEDKVTINPSVLTVVDRTFGDVGKSNGSIITLSQINQKNSAQLFITSFPYGADISVDNNSSGATPQLISSITDSDHDVVISKDGYRSKTIRIHGVLGYKLNVLVYLATDISPIATPSAELPQQPVSTKSASLQGPTVTILSTPTGFLRVRDAASLGGNEIAQVHPGESYPLASEQTGWFQIKLSDGKLGWVSSSYAQANKF